MKIAQIEAKLIDSMGSDLSVVNAARVSFDKVSEEFAAKDEKLIQYLAKHKHFSPFNHTFLTFRVKAPIFVARQLVKHKFMPWNEVSRRYVDSEPEFAPLQYRWAVSNVKQGSGGAVDEVTQSDAEKYMNNLIKHALGVYDWMLEKGICAEQARAALPLLSHTEWMWSGTLGAYADMLKLRLDPHTQYESRIVAEQIKEQIAQVFPVSLNALLENK